MRPLPLALFAQRIATYRDQTNASVTSWGRTVDHNKAVGGVRKSFHLVDLAVDLVYDHPIDEPTARELARSLGLKLIRETDHDHLEPLT